MLSQFDTKDAIQRTLQILVSTVLIGGPSWLLLQAPAQYRELRSLRDAHARDFDVAERLNALNAQIEASESKYYYLPSALFQEFVARVQADSDHPQYAADEGDAFVSSLEVMCGEGVRTQDALIARLEPYKAALAPYGEAVESYEATLLARQRMARRFCQMFQVDEENIGFVIGQEEVELANALLAAEERLDETKALINSLMEHDIGELNDKVQSQTRQLQLRTLLIIMGFIVGIRVAHLALRKELPGEAG